MHRMRTIPDLTAGQVDNLESRRARADLAGFLLGTGLVLAEPERLVDEAAWVGHIPFAFWVVDALRPRSFVELGTHSGCSYSAFLQAIDTLGLATSCHAVDTWKGDAQAGFYGENVYQELAAYHDARYGGFSRLLRMTFDAALAQFSDGSIDLLHIDGLHTYEAVSHDLHSWLPKLSSRGLVLMHDIDVREPGFEVWRLWEEVSARYPAFSFLHSHGLGVAWVGTDAMPAPIAWLTSLAGQDAATGVDIVRSYFHRLGSGLIDRVGCNARDRALAERDRTLAERDRALAERDDDLAQRGREIAALTSVLAQCDGRINTLTSELAGLLHEQRERQKYWGFAPVVHAPRDFSRLMRRKLGGNPAHLPISANHTDHRRPIE